MAQLVPENTTRKLDALGRITLPKGLRDRMFLSDNAELELFTANIDGRQCICLSKPITEEEAKYHPKKNVLMRALGATEKVQMDIFDVDMNNEGILLCSDGLTTMLADDQIEKVLIDEELDAEEKVVKLIQKCNARGGFDNVSIAYLEKDEGDN